MSNPAVRFLGSANIKGTEVRIEDNIGESIHVHAGLFRLTLTVDEYEEFCNAVLDAAREILKLKGLDLDMIDLTSLDWDWLESYDRIQRIEKTEVFLNELYSIRETWFGSQITCKVSENRLSDAFKGKFKGIDKFKSVSIRDVSKRERLTQICDLLKEEGYPYDNKYIMVDQYNRIYDGDHRAAALLHLHGNIIIPVIKLYIDGAKPVDKEIKRQKIKGVKKFIRRILGIIKRTLIRCLKYIKMMLKPSQIRSGISFSSESEFVSFLKENDISYYVVNDYKDITDTDFDKLYVITRETMDILREKCQGSFTDAITDFGLLYSMPRPVYLNLNGNKVLVSENLFCRSMYEKSIMPLEKNVQEYGINNIKPESDDSDYSQKVIRMLILLLDSTLNQRLLSEEQKAYISNNREVLEKDDLRSLLQCEFFNYADSMVDSLLDGDYVKAIKGYVQFREY